MINMSKTSKTKNLDRIIKLRYATIHVTSKIKV